MPDVIPLPTLESVEQRVLQQLHRDEHVSKEMQDQSDFISKEIEHIKVQLDQLNKDVNLMSEKRLWYEHVTSWIETITSMIEAKV